MEIQHCLAAALAAVLLCATSVSAGARYFHFQSTELNNRHFADNTLFVNGSVRSGLDCAVHCANHPGCETFTFTHQASSGLGTCQGHSVALTSGSTNDPAVEAKTYVLLSSPAIDTSGPCAAGGHVEIDDFRRDVNNEDNMEMCVSDPVFPIGWYRFFINGSSASMPTYCPPSGRCGTHAPMWLDLQNTTLPPVEQEVKARACASWSAQCCFSTWERPVIVRNCGGFYVYYLQETQQCYYTYCAEL